MARKLTAKQEEFAKLVAAGSNLSDAYRKAYNANYSNNVMKVRGYETSTNPNVAAKIKELKNEVKQLELWRKEDSIRALISVVNEPSRPSDVVAAVKELNMMHGFNAAMELKHIGDADKPIKIDLSISPAEAYKKMIGK